MKLELSIEEMKKVLKGYIDNISENDYVRFNNIYEKGDNKVFTKHLVLEIDWNAKVLNKEVLNNDNDGESRV